MLHRFARGGCCAPGKRCRGHSPEVTAAQTRVQEGRWAPCELAEASICHRRPSRFSRPTPLLSRHMVQTEARRKRKEMEAAAKAGGTPLPAAAAGRLAHRKLFQNAASDMVLTASKRMLSQPLRSLGCTSCFKTPQLPHTPGQSLPQHHSPTTNNQPRIHVAESHQGLSAVIMAVAQKS